MSTPSRGRRRLAPRAGDGRFLRALFRCRALAGHTSTGRYHRSQSRQTNFDGRQTHRPIAERHATTTPRIPARFIASSPTRESEYDGADTSQLPHVRSLVRAWRDRCHSLVRIGRIRLLVTALRSATLQPAKREHPALSDFSFGLDNPAAKPSSPVRSPGRSAQTGFSNKWAMTDSNRRHPRCKRGALAN